MTDLTTQQRWRAALAAARAAGVIVKTNVNMCCNSCANKDVLGIPEEERGTPYAYFLRTQGRRVAFTRNGVRHKDTTKIVYFQWGNGAGRRLAAAFRAQGFKVTWDGTRARAVGVQLDSDTRRAAEPAAA